MQQDAFERAVRHIPKPDLDRLIDQLTPLAKCPDYINVTDEVGAVTREWFRHRELSSRAPWFVWDYLRDKFAKERDIAGDRDVNMVVVVHRPGGPQQFKIPYACITATEYFALRGDAAAKPDPAEAPKHPTTKQRFTAALRAIF